MHCHPPSSRRQSIGIASLVALLAFGATSSDAAPILLDQQYVPTVGAVGVVINQNSHLAQTFTVGIDGILSSVEVEIARGVPLGDSITLSILSAPGGTPDLSAVLASALISPSQVTRTFTFVSVDLSAAMLEIAVGQQLAIHLTTTPIDNRNTYLWRADSIGFYEGGSGFSSSPTRANVRDHGFRTFVDTQQIQTVPEPASLALLGVGLLGVGCRKAASRRRASRRLSTLARSRG